jgi:hypothetical protein
VVARVPFEDVVWAAVAAGEDVAAGAVLSSPQAASRPATRTRASKKVSTILGRKLAFPSTLHYDTTIL